MQHLPNNPYKNKPPQPFKLWPSCCGHHVGPKIDHVSWCICKVYFKSVINDVTCSSPDPFCSVHQFCFAHGVVVRLLCWDSGGTRAESLLPTWQTCHQFVMSKRWPWSNFEPPFTQKPAGAPKPSSVIVKTMPSDFAPQDAQKPVRSAKGQLRSSD